MAVDNRFHHKDLGNGRFVGEDWVSCKGLNAEARLVGSGVPETQDSQGWLFVVAGLGSRGTFAGFVKADWVVGRYSDGLASRFGHGVVGSGLLLGTHARKGQIWGEFQAFLG